MHRHIDKHRQIHTITQTHAQLRTITHTHMHREIHTTTHIDTHTPELKKGGHIVKARLQYPARRLQFYSGKKHEIKEIVFLNISLK